MSADYFLAAEWHLAELLGQLPDDVLQVIRYCVTQERDLLDLSLDVPPAGLVTTQEIEAWTSRVNQLAEALALVEAL